MFFIQESSGLAFYGSLRLELLMLIHDDDVTELIDIDPCHKYGWCLDVCIRERHMENKLAREILTALDSHAPGHDAKTGEFWRFTIFVLFSALA